MSSTAQKAAALGTILTIFVFAWLLTDWPNPPPPSSLRAWLLS